MYFMLNDMRFRVHSGSDPFSGARSWIDMMTEAEEIKRARGQSCSLDGGGGCHPNRSQEGCLASWWEVVNSLFPVAIPSRTICISSVSWE